jgi:hypothetical protein
MYRSTLLGLPLLWLALVQPVSAWGPEGHRAIALLAEQSLSPEVRAIVHELLIRGRSSNLAAVSTWADDVREASRGRGPLVNDPEAASFNQAFPENFLWHFVDLPLGTENYRLAKQFTSAQDVVHTIQRCIKVLESASPLPDEFNQVQALRLLVHFVADIHQPFHCVSGFYRLSESRAPALVTDPAQAFGLPSDRGGNELFFDPQHQLHAFWDATIVEAIIDSRNPAQLAQFLRARFNDVPVPETKGDYRDWPIAWAEDSVAAARAAYAGITFRGGTLNEDKRSVRLWVSLPADYLNRSTSLAAQQLFKASQRLAQLLSRIQFNSR